MTKGGDGGLREFVYGILRAVTPVVLLGVIGALVIGPFV